MAPILFYTDTGHIPIKIRYVSSDFVLWHIISVYLRSQLSLNMYFLPLRISLLFFSQVTSNGDVPATSHSNSTSLSFTTSTGFSSLIKVGGSKDSKGEQRGAYSSRALRPTRKHKQNGNRFRAQTFHF